METFERAFARFLANIETAPVSDPIKRTALELWRFLMNYLESLPEESINISPEVLTQVAWNENDQPVWLWEINESNFECDIYFLESGLTDWYISTNGMVISVDGPLHRIMPVFLASYRFKDLPMIGSDSADN